MTNLIGTEKEKQWAYTIRDTIFKNMETTKGKLRPHLSEEQYELLVLLLEKRYPSLAEKHGVTTDQAQFWLKTRLDASEDGFGTISYFIKMNYDFVEDEDIKFNYGFLYEICHPIFLYIKEIPFDKGQLHDLSDELTNELAVFSSSVQDLCVELADLEIELQGDF